MFGQSGRCVAAMLRWKAVVERSNFDGGPRLEKREKKDRDKAGVVNGPPRAKCLVLSDEFGSGYFGYLGVTNLTSGRSRTSFETLPGCQDLGMRVWTRYYLGWCEYV